jgi:hypothetical protein
MPWRHNPDREGATVYGSHYWSQWDSCQRQWWLAKRAPHPDGTGEGLTPFGTDRNLLFGRYFHEALEAYYLSGWQDGQYNLELALEQSTNLARTYSSDWQDDSAFDEDIAKCRRMLTDYHDATGQDSQNPDFPHFRVATDKLGAPLIEREFSIALDDHTRYTARLDGIVEWGGALYSLEHKTTGSMYFAKDLRASLHLALQVAGQCLVANSPEAFAVLGRPVAGVILNMIPKRRVMKPRSGDPDPAFLRDTVTYTRAQLAKVQIDLVRRQAQQDAANNEYDALVSDGTNPWEAGASVFPATGPQTSSCFKYNRFCEWYGVCRAVGLEHSVASGYRVSQRFDESNPNQETE